jgi:hypothetical protein
LIRQIFISLVLFMTAVGNVRWRRIYGSGHHTIAWFLGHAP